MPEKSENRYMLVMEKVPDDRQPETALFLSRCFSLPPPSARNIAASGPIALLADLSGQQAGAVLAELKTALPPDVIMRVTESSASLRISRLQWPRPPRIYGRDVNDFVIAGDARGTSCPLCGGQLRIIKDGDGVKLVSAGGERKKEVGESKRTLPSNDDDPLFSGIKPLAAGSGNYASIRSLQAGDTGFWMDHSHFAYSAQPQSDSQAGERHEDPGTTTVKRTTVRNAGGQAAFMKPGAFAVVAARTKDTATVKMIAEIMGIPETEARERSLTLGLCVARDISLNEAQSLLARFKKLGSRARIVKPS